jgi:acid phosphatase type 7
MKVTPRFWLRAGLVLCAAGALGAFGACSKDTTAPPPPPPPPPPPLTAPTNVTAQAVSQTKINVAWQDADTTVTGFELQRCSGPGCSNFAKLTTTLKGIMTFGDSGLTANTSYSYRVRATKGADTSAFSATASATTGVIGGSSAFTMVGAGEIMNTCGGSPGTAATAHLVDSVLTADTAAVAFVAGDALTDTVAGTKFATCYDPTWGKFKSRTYLAIGNGDYAGGRGETDIFSYWGNRTGPQNQGFGSFSFERGNWHVVFINSANFQQGNTQLQDPNGAMNSWLASDLAQVPSSKCIAVFSFERRIYTDNTGNLGTQFNLKQATAIMDAAHADILVSSKDKLYARFPMMNLSSNTPAKDSATGTREFIVGTGGRSFDALVTPTATNPVEKQSNTSWGVLKLTLAASSYSWEFIPTRADGFKDSGGPIPCHS